MFKGEFMSSAVITTVVKMMESAPESIQRQIMEHLRLYFEELKDEAEWDSLVSQTQPELIKAARRAKEEIHAGQATPMDYSRL
jgi:hypothetical protein